MTRLRYGGPRCRPRVERRLDDVAAAVRALDGRVDHLVAATGRGMDAAARLASIVTDLDISVARLQRDHVRHRTATETISQRLAVLAPVNDR